MEKLWYKLKRLQSVLRPLSRQFTNMQNQIQQVRQELHQAIKPPSHVSSIAISKLVTKLPSKVSFFFLLVNGVCFAGQQTNKRDGGEVAGYGVVTCNELLLHWLRDGIDGGGYQRSWSVFMWGAFGLDRAFYGVAGEPIHDSVHYHTRSQHSVNNNEHLHRLIGSDGCSPNWRVQFYMSPYAHTRLTLHEFIWCFLKKRIVGVREESLVREWDFGNFQVKERVKSFLKFVSEIH
ncbi:hypothetical protein JHK87_027950 [Glycine soja]|nr:hypothetical protein JHK87_027950 [Glycine soja]